MALSPHHRQKVEQRGFSGQHIQYLSTANGKPATLESLTAEEIQANWLGPFPSMRGNPGGALLLRFNETTISLKPDEPDWDEDHQRFTKYLYAKRESGSPAGSNTQPWIPSKSPEIATEGLFDALACTSLIGIPCAAATAPSHLRRSRFPASVKTYINDADVPFHHSPSLLPVVVEQCREKCLKIAHLPRNPKANYAYTGAHIPDDCKWGMEEWAKQWQADGLDPKAELQRVISGALDPVNYLRQICKEYREVGIWYPEHLPVLENFGKAIASATSSPSKRRSLRDLLHECTGTPTTWIDDQIKSKDPEHNPTAPEPTEWQLQVERINAIADPVKRTEKAWELIHERAAGVVLSGAKVIHQQSVIKALGREFKLQLDKRDVDQVLSDVVREATTKVEPVMGGGRLTVVAKRWVLQDLMLHGFNLLNGMPGAGKSRFLMAFVRAWLTGQDTFVGHKLYAQPNSRVLILGLDQDLQEWADVMAPLGLMSTVSSDDDFTEYDLHSSIDLYPLGCGVTLDRDGLQLVSRWTANNPGGLIIGDSVSALLPTGVTEGDDSLGRWARDIDEARRAAPLVLTHHITKESAFNGNTGVYSGRGSGSLDGAVSRVLGLSYLFHKENGKDVLHKTSPRRQLVSEKRGSTNQDLIIEMGPSGCWDFIGTSQEQRQLEEEDATGQATQERLKGWKKAAWEATTDNWLHTSQILSRLNPEKAKAKNASQQLRRTLRDLITDHDLLESKGSEQFQGEMLWRRKPE